MSVDSAAGWVGLFVILPCGGVGYSSSSNNEVSLAGGGGGYGWVVVVVGGPVTGGGVNRWQLARICRHQEFRCGFLALTLCHSVRCHRQPEAGDHVMTQRLIHHGALR